MTDQALDPKHGSANVKVGRIIRDLRLVRGWSGQELAARAGMSQPKLSKLEHGQGTFVESDIGALLTALAAPKVLQQEVEVLLRIIHNRPAALGAYEMGFDIDTKVGREARAALIQMYCINALPVIFQTPGYQTALLRQYGADDRYIAKSLALNQRRQDRLWQPGKRYELLCAEMALYGLLVPVADHLVQLDRLERLALADNFSFGIIPVTAGLPAVMQCNFVILDTAELVLELAEGDIVIQSERSIDQYRMLFNDLLNRAHTGRDAVALIRRAADYFNVA